MRWAWGPCIERGRRLGLRLVRRRIGRWKARVLRVTSRRKKRYCRIKGWAWRIVAFVASEPGAL